MLVELVLGGEGLLEGDGEGGDSMVVGSTLVAREDTVGHVSGFSVGRVLGVGNVPEVDRALQVV